MGEGAFPCGAEGEAAASAPGRSGRGVRYGAAAARAVLARVAAGESVRGIARDAGMPAAHTVGRWCLERPGFAAALRAARVAAGTPLRPGGWSSYCEATAGEILRRVAAGEALIRVCEDPSLPVVATVYRWRRDVPAFGAALSEAMEARAEGFFELGWDLAMGATPETAFVTKVRLEHLRWHVGKLAPKKYGVKPEGEAAAEPEGLTVIVRRFTDAPMPGEGVGEAVGEAVGGAADAEPVIRYPRLDQGRLSDAS